MRFVRARASRATRSPVHTSRAVRSARQVCTDCQVRPAGQVSRPRRAPLLLAQPPDLGDQPRQHLAAGSLQEPVGHRGDRVRFWVDVDQGRAGLLGQ
jgi:hypothetical protein